MGLTPEQRSRRASLAADVLWSKTPDRAAHTAAARAAGPNGLDYHMKRLGPEFATATDEQKLAAAESARRAYFKKMAWDRERRRKVTGAGDRHG
jgi:hypothetical protein